MSYNSRHKGKQKQRPNPSAGSIGNVDNNLQRSKSTSATQRRATRPENESKGSGSSSSSSPDPGGGASRPERQTITIGDGWGAFFGTGPLSTRTNQKFNNLQQGFNDLYNVKNESQRQLADLERYSNKIDRSSITKEEQGKLDSVFKPVQELLKDIDALIQAYGDQAIHYEQMGPVNSGIDRAIKNDASIDYRLLMDQLDKLAIEQQSRKVREREERRAKREQEEVNRSRSREAEAKRKKADAEAEATKQAAASAERQAELNAEAARRADDNAFIDQFQQNMLARLTVRDNVVGNNLTAAQLNEIFGAAGGKESVLAVRVSADLDEAADRELDRLHAHIIATVKTNLRNTYTNPPNNLDADLTEFIYRRAIDDGLGVTALRDDLADALTKRDAINAHIPLPGSPAIDPDIQKVLLGRAVGDRVNADEFNTDIMLASDQQIALTVFMAAHPNFNAQLGQRLFERGFLNRDVILDFNARLTTAFDRQRALSSRQWSQALNVRVNGNPNDFQVQDLSNGHHGTYTQNAIRRGNVSLFDPLTGTAKTADAILDELFDVRNFVNTTGKTAAEVVDEFRELGFAVSEFRPMGAPRTVSEVLENVDLLQNHVSNDGAGDNRSHLYWNGATYRHPDDGRDWPTEILPELQAGMQEWRNQLRASVQNVLDLDGNLPGRSLDHI